MSKIKNWREQPLQSFLYVIATCYLFGFILHLIDLFFFRAPFAEQGVLKKSWFLYLLGADLFMSVLLFKKSKWGVWALHVVALSQLLVYGIYENLFGRQPVLVVFHVLTLLTYWKIVAHQKRQQLLKK